MKKSIFYIALAISAMASTQAHADFVCTNGNPAQGLKSFHLGSGFQSFKAAVILKKNHIQSLLTGDVEIRWTRFGANYVYKLQDENGEPATVKGSDVFFGGGSCGRGSCDPVFNAVSATLEYLGEEYAFNCVKVVQ